MSPAAEHVVVREVAEDCRDLLTLRRSWSPDVADTGFEQRFREWWARERDRRRALVAYEGDTPVGMANGQVFSRMPAPGRQPARWMYVANVYVPDEHRRRGIGGLLMRGLVDIARADRMLRVVLAPSPMSVPFYEALGFRVAHDLLRLDLAEP